MIRGKYKADRYDDSDTSYATKLKECFNLIDVTVQSSFQEFCIRYKYVTFLRFNKGCQSCWIIKI